MQKVSVLYGAAVYHYTDTHTCHTHIHTHIHTHAHTHGGAVPEWLVCVDVQSLCEERFRGVCVWRRMEQHGGVGVGPGVGVQGAAGVGGVALLGQQRAGVFTREGGHALETWMRQTETSYSLVYYTRYI